MRRLTTIAAILLAWCAALAPATAKPPMEAFGDLPEVRSMQISPDGKQLVWLMRLDSGGDVLVHYDLVSGKSKMLAQVSQVQARRVQFLSNEHVVVIASEDTKIENFRRRFEYSSAFSYNLKTGKFTQLLRSTEGLFPAQAGLGTIVGVAPDQQNVMMPAFMGTAYTRPELDLLRVSLENGRGSVIIGAKGTDHTIDWLVNSKGTPIVREDFNQKEKVHDIRFRDGDSGSWKSIYKKTVESSPEISIVGTSLDAKLLYVVDAEESEFARLRTISTTDGKLSEPLMQRNDADIGRVITDRDKQVLGVEYTGMFPTYDMFDQALEDDIAHVQGIYEGSAVHLAHWSADWSKLLFLAHGGYRAERYVLFDRATRKASVVSQARPKITENDVGEVMTINYKARDGLVIPALVTWPVNVTEENRKKLPLIVMPHGGPESADTVGFDWLAQYLANEGYVVLQPNFRGSAEFGGSFTAAGYGEWGRKMQDDITDGANALIKMGWGDPNRTCIVGWSYGGYAALAGGALTPDLYKCVVAVAGVSHLRDMLFEEKRQHGEDGWVYSYWLNFIGNPETDKEAIDAVSPALLADKFKAPVLLVHGDTDRIVPIHQSDVMNDALKKAGKDVKYLRISGDDHSLVDNASRRQFLTELTAFLKMHTGGAAN